MKETADILRNYHDLKSIHFLTHGSKGKLQLLGRNYDALALGQSQEFLTEISSALAKDGELFFYGCEIGKDREGQDFVNMLSKFLGRPVAASINKTGSPSLGGDWILERQSSPVHASSLNLGEWNSILAR